MSIYWLATTQDPICIEAEDEAAATTVAENSQFTVVKVLGTLPYPAYPRVGPKSDCPTFCSHPNECVGYSSCPRDLACND